MEDIRQYQLKRNTTAEAEKQKNDADAGGEGMTCPVDNVDTQGALAQRQLLCLLEVIFLISMVMSPSGQCVDFLADLNNDKPLGFVDAYQKACSKVWPGDKPYRNSA